MHGFKNARERLARPGYAAGGEVAAKAKLIRGPGTATSDSIPAKAQAGTVILPADTTAELQDVNLSNGESGFSPQVVQAVGAAALLAMRDATHTPAAAGFQPAPGGAQGLADGGLVGEDERRRAALSQIPTTGYRPAPEGNRIDSTELSRNVGNAIMAIPGGAGAAGGLRSAASAVRGVDAAASAVRGGAAAVVPYATPAAGFVGLSNAADASGPAAPPPPAAAATPSPTALGVPSSSTGTAAQPPAGGAGPLNPGNVQIMGTLSNNIVRSGNSYSSGDGGPITEGATINGREVDRVTVLPSAREVLARPTESFLPAGFQPQQYQAPRPFTATGGSFGIRRDPSIEQAARIDNANYNRAIGADAVSRRLAVQQAEVGAQRERTAVTAQDNYARNMLGAARLGFEGRSADAETAARQRRAAAENSYLNARTPEERSAALATLQALTGGTPAPRFTVVPGGTDDMGNRQASAVFNNQTGQFVPQQSGARAAPQAGAVEGGYRFKGGNPADQKNWEKV